MKQNKGRTNVNIELDRVAFHKQEAVKVVTDYSRLLASPKEQKKVAVMRGLHWDQGITRTEQELGREKDRSTVMSALQHNAVSKRQEIKDIAVTYDLKFLPASKFMCPEKKEHELATMLTDFMENKNLDNNAFSFANHFYVLADERYFVKHCMDIDDEIGAFIFYLPPKQDENFVRVGNCGDGELTFKRYIRGWRRKEPLNGIIHASSSAFLVSFPLFGLLSGGSIGAAFVCSLLISALAAVALIHGAKKKGGFSSHTWDHLPPKGN